MPAFGGGRKITISAQVFTAPPAMILRKNGPCLRCLTVFQTGTSGYRKSEHQAPKAEAGEKFGRSREYRIGRAVCYYQWFSGRSYGEIFSVLSFSDLESLYSPLHEAVISKFAAIAEKRMRECLPETSLKLLRKICGCTEAELARLSGGTLRSVRRMSSGARISTGRAPKLSTGFPEYSAAP